MHAISRAYISSRDRHAGTAFTSVESRSCVWFSCDKDRTYQQQTDIAVANRNITAHTIKQTHLYIQLQYL